MKTHTDPSQLFRILHEVFDVPLEHIKKMQLVKDLDYVEKLLNEAKNMAKKTWRQKAMVLHPDRGGNVDEFKELNNNYESIQGMSVNRHIPQPLHLMPIHIVLSQIFDNEEWSYNNYSGTGNTTSGTGNPWGGSSWTVIIK